MSFEITVPVLPKSLNESRYEHHMVRYRREGQEKFLVSSMLNTSKIPKPPLPVKVTLVRCSSGVLDDDNATASMKHIRDVIAKWYGVDDGDPEKIQFIVTQEKVRRKSQGTKVRIETRS